MNDTTKIFMGNLDDEVSAEDLVSWLAEIEVAVISVKVIDASKSWDSRKHAYVTLPKPDDVAKAVARFAGAPQASGALIKCEACKPRASRKSYTPRPRAPRLFVSIGYHLDQEGLEALIAELGIVLTPYHPHPVQVLTHDDGRPKGCAFVFTIDQAEAARAIQILTGYDAGSWRLKAEIARDISDRPAKVSREEIEASCFTSRSLLPPEVSHE